MDTIRVAKCHTIRRRFVRRCVHWSLRATNYLPTDGDNKDDDDDDDDDVNDADDKLDVSCLHARLLPLLAIVVLDVVVVVVVVDDAGGCEGVDTDTDADADSIFS